MKRKVVLMEPWGSGKVLEVSASPVCPLRKMWFGVNVLDLWVDGGGGSGYPANNRSRGWGE